jgi:hypothetical protein
VLAILTFVLTRTLPWFKARRDRRSVQKRIGAESYTPAGLENAFRNFIPPMCQDVDPSGGDEPRNVYGVKQPLFSALDDALSRPDENKYFILLADSGMGKTTALLNYYLRHIRRWREPGYKLALVPLNITDADERIAAITGQEDTVLFLDALDEDTLAIVDYVERLRLLLKATAKFRAVLISCRTQFFSKDEEIPKETGRIKVVDRRAGQEAEYYFQKIYLSPFNDVQVKRYITRKYPFWRKERKKAFTLIQKIPHLTARPMLLAHIDDLLKSKRAFTFSYELYEEMVNAWLAREKGFIKDENELLEFSKKLAVDLYVNRVGRRAERIRKKELAPLARGWKLQLDDWKLSGRSLLNRDAEGNFKFAHRSIMEYLFVQRFLADDPLTVACEWTDQMHIFLFEYLLKVFMGRNGPIVTSSTLPSLIGSDDRLKITVSSITLGLRKGFIDETLTGSFITGVVGSALVDKGYVPNVDYYLLKGFRIKGKSTLASTGRWAEDFEAVPLFRIRFSGTSPSVENLSQRKVIQAEAATRRTGATVQIEEGVNELRFFSVAGEPRSHPHLEKAFLGKHTEGGSILVIRAEKQIPKALLQQLTALYAAVVAAH